MTEIVSGASEAKKVNNNKMGSFSMAQFLVPEYWGAEAWGEEQANFNVESFDLQWFLPGVVKRLQDAGGEVFEAHAIVHDRDVIPLADGSFSTKEPHVHLIVKFMSRKDGLNLNTVATALGLAPNYIEKPSSGRYSWDNTLAYLVHSKDPEKFQYSPNDVESFGRTGATSYHEYYNESIERWRKGGAVKQARKVGFGDWRALREVLFARVVYNREFANKIEFVKQMKLDSDYYATYLKFKREIDGWFEGLEEERMLELAEALRNGRFSTKVVYVTGKPGSGKTSYVAKPLIEGLLKENPAWRVFYGGSSNVVDGYNGEEIVFLDDLRGGAMTGHDWLKLLDPHMATPVSARYKNRTVVAQHIIITSVLPVYEFFYYVKGMGSSRDEPLEQFIRRLMAVIEVYDGETGRRIDVRGIEEGVGGDKKTIAIRASGDYAKVILDVGKWVGDTLIGGPVDAVLPLLVDAMNEDKVDDVKRNLLALQPSMEVETLLDLIEAREEEEVGEFPF